MTEKQKRFVDNYCRSGNAASAARESGYSTRTARSIGERLLKQKEVRMAIKERLRVLESERIAKSEEVLEHLTEVLRGAITEQVVTNKGSVVEARVRESERIKAAEILLKVHGAFREKIDVKMSGVEVFMEAVKRAWE